MAVQEEEVIIVIKAAEEALVIPLVRVERRAMITQIVLRADLEEVPAEVK
jgi:hypothetical protein